MQLWQFEEGYVTRFIALTDENLFSSNVAKDHTTQVREELQQGQLAEDVFERHGMFVEGVPLDVIAAVAKKDDLPNLGIDYLGEENLGTFTLDVENVEQREEVFQSLVELFGEYGSIEEKVDTSDRGCMITFAIIIVLIFAGLGWSFSGPAPTDAEIREKTLGLRGYLIGKIAVGLGLPGMTLIGVLCATFLLMHSWQRIRTPPRTVTLYRLDPGGASEVP